MKVKINYREWEIIEAPQECIRKASSDDGKLYFGLTVYEPAKIYILETLDRSEKTNTLAHELAHAYLFAYTQISAGFTEEELCTLVGNMYQFIREIESKYFKRL